MEMDVCTPWINPDVRQLCLTDALIVCFATKQRNSRQLQVTLVNSRQLDGESAANKPVRNLKARTILLLLLLLV